MLEDFRGRFDAHADIDGVARKFKTVMLGLRHEPFRTFAPRRGDEVLGADIFVADLDALHAPAFKHELGHFRIATDIDFTRERFAHIFQNFDIDIGAEMANARRDQREIGGGRAPFQLRDRFRVLIAVDFTIRPAVLTVYGIDMVDLFLQGGFAHEVIQVAAVFRRQRQLAVGKRAGTAPAANDIAAAFFERRRAIRVLRGARCDVMSFFQD